MDYSKKQSELDIVKWIDSETKNYDTCGEYNYCANCNKNEAYPCAYAYELYTSLAKAIKNSAKSTTSRKLKTTTTTNKKSTTSKKTSITSKKSTTAKKATTTRRTTKNTVKA